MKLDLISLLLCSTIYVDEKRGIIYFGLQNVGMQIFINNREFFSVGTSSTFVRVYTMFPRTKTLYSIIDRRLHVLRNSVKLLKNIHSSSTILIFVIEIKYRTILIDHESLSHQLTETLNHHPEDSFVAVEINSRQKKRHLMIQIYSILQRGVRTSKEFNFFKTRSGSSHLVLRKFYQRYMSVKFDLQELDAVAS